MKLLIINGPNLNMLGLREPDIYGKADFQALLSLLRETGAALGVRVDQFQSNHEGALVDAIQQAYGVYDGIEAEVFQSNHEGAIVDKIQSAYGTADGIVINPAAYTHTSVAILDALKAVNLPAVEVHISDVNSREAFRHVSYAGMACIATYAGYGFEGYKMAIERLAGAK